jgi:uncharacterized protein
MILIDTGYFLALFDPADELRERAISWSNVLRERCLVTEYVIWECVNALSEPQDRSTAHPIVNHLRANPGYEIISATPDLFDLGLRLHRDRPDKAWSLTDCVSFHIMQQRGIQKALAYDEHFEQAGYTALLRRSPPVVS